MHLQFFKMCNKDYEIKLQKRNKLKNTKLTSWYILEMFCNCKNSNVEFPYYHVRTLPKNTLRTD